MSDRSLVADTILIVALLVYFVLLLMIPASHTYADNRCVWTDKFDKQIQQSVRRYWALELPGIDWRVQKALMIQESSLNPEAQPEGSTAYGLGQLLDGTWEETSRRLDLRGGRRNIQDQIEASTFYLADNASFWISQRPINEKLLLALPSYYAGRGNIYNAQIICDNLLFWEDIKPCVKDDHAKIYPNLVYKHYQDLKENCNER